MFLSCQRFLGTCALLSSDTGLDVAVRNALREHKRLDQSVAVSPDGKVVTLAPEDIPVDLKNKAA